MSNSALNFESAEPAKAEDMLIPFDFPAAERKKVAAGFDGGSYSSGGGLALLHAAGRPLGQAEVLTGCVREWCGPD